jgi:hypothetical protein
MIKHITTEDGRMNLQHALKKLREQYPWLPEAALRRAVAAGKIPSIRSSDAKRAHYYVYLEDLIAALPRAGDE